MSDLFEERLCIGEVELTLLRPREPEALLDQEAFEDDEFLPYWAELWPAGLALAEALPARLDDLRVIELGCGLGIPSLVAAARGARVTAIDWAPEAIALLHTNAKAHGLAVDAQVCDWRALDGEYDLALAADVLYERRNVDPLVMLVQNLAPATLLALAGRPNEAEFLHLVDSEPVSERVVRVLGRRSRR